jgi:hypothetical protein
MHFYGVVRARYKYYESFVLSTGVDAMDVPRRRRPRVPRGGGLYFSFLLCLLLLPR